MCKFAEKSEALLRIQKILILGSGKILNDIKN